MIFYSETAGSCLQHAGRKHNGFQSSKGVGAVIAFVCVPGPLLQRCSGNIIIAIAQKVGGEQTTQRLSAGAPRASGQVARCLPRPCRPQQLAHGLALHAPRRGLPPPTSPPPARPRSRAASPRCLAVPCRPRGGGQDTATGHLLLTGDKARTRAW